MNINNNNYGHTQNIVNNDGATAAAGQQPQDPSFPPEYVDRMLAACMAADPRCGSASQLALLNPELMHIIAQNLPYSVESAFYAFLQILQREGARPIEQRRFDRFVIVNPTEVRIISKPIASEGEPPATYKVTVDIISRNHQTYSRVFWSEREQFKSNADRTIDQIRYMYDRIITKLEHSCSLQCAFKEIVKRITKDARQQGWSVKESSGYRFAVVNPATLARLECVLHPKGLLGESPFLSIHTKGVQTKYDHISTDEVDKLLTNIDYFMRTDYGKLLLDSGLPAWIERYCPLWKVERVPSKEPPQFTIIDIANNDNKQIADLSSTYNRTLFFGADSKTVFWSMEVQFPGEIDTVLKKYILQSYRSIHPTQDN